MLDVLHCVLIDSPEALNMMRVTATSFTRILSKINLNLKFEFMALDFWDFLKGFLRIFKDFY